MQNVNEVSLDEQELAAGAAEYQGLPEDGVIQSDSTEVEAKSSLSISTNEQDPHSCRKEILLTSAEIDHYLNDIFFGVKERGLFEPFVGIGDSLELVVYRDFTKVDIRYHDHQHLYKVSKLTNIGWGRHNVEFADALRALAPTLPEYCFNALTGDTAAMRQTAEWRLSEAKAQIDTIRKIRHDQEKRGEKLSYTNLYTKLLKEVQNLERLLDIEDDRNFKAYFKSVDISILKVRREDGRIDARRND